MNLKLTSGMRSGMYNILENIPDKTEDAKTTSLKFKKDLINFLGDDYKNKDYYTGKELGIPIHYLSRDHGWSATKFKEKIYEQIKNK